MQRIALRHIDFEVAVGIGKRSFGIVLHDNYRSSDERRAAGVGDVTLHSVLRLSGEKSTPPNSVITSA